MEILAWLIAGAVVTVGALLIFTVISAFGKLKNYNKTIEKALEKGDYMKAEKIALRYVDSYPEDFILKYYLGQAYEGQKNYAKAIFYYEKAALLVSVETDAHLRSQFYLRIADLYKRRQQYKEAIGYYALVLEKDPRNSKALFSAGECCFQLGLYSKAWEHLSTYVTLKPDNVRAFYLLAETCEKLGKFEEAFQNYEQIVENHATTDEVLTTKSMYRSALLAKKLQNYQKSEKYLRQLLEVDQYYEDALKELVGLLVLTERVEEAIHLVQDFEKEVSPPTRADLYFHIGNGYFKNKEYYTAIQTWKKGFQDNPSHPQLRELVNRYADILTHKGMEIYFGRDQHQFELFLEHGFPYKEIRGMYHEGHLSVLQVQETMVVLYRAPFSFKEKEIAIVENILKSRFNAAPFFTLYALYGVEGWDEVKIKEQNQIELVFGKGFIEWLEQTYDRFQKKKNE
ncbi:tetratricopeptide repeat protein [Thermospira aquatica]|uniref:Tetratricopeptide repeat protein n=1 Tax=Thermospira aquatica TaxID=2828656 RepID=A0AAX3BBS4_9SPIR|nr:tetratricopeptide repeat protein [Thermospira aquatica]URA09459.1 tetratricopeptide repeat protein [Thermospira aquatica]